MTRSRASARRMVLRELIDSGEISSQEELLHRLKRRGHVVTQTTVSRDLQALGVEKRSDGSGEPVYRLTATTGDPGDDLVTRMLREFAVQIEPTRNLVVIKTPPGGAHPVASALDQTPPGVLGTVAGDDTVLIVTRTDNGGARLARMLRKSIGG